MPEVTDLSTHPVLIRTAMPGPLAKAEIARQQPHMSPSLIHCYPLMVKRASGCMVEDIDGNVLLDVQAGVATASTGHCHPAVAAAMKQQVDTLIHICGTDFFYPGYGELCERLNKLAPHNEKGWQTFLSNSGTEAVEAAIKLARYHTGRSQLIAFRGGFHGRTLGSLSLTASKPKYRKGFGPLTPGTHHVEYGDWQSIDRLFHTTVPAQEVAAIVVEPVQGEGGYIVPPASFLQNLRAICDEHGILLIFDEVQSGMGRTGKMFAAEHFGVLPDIITLAKGIASGMPLGAMMARKEIMTWGGGSHGSTCGGNPVCIAAALATLDLLEGGLVQNAAVVGDAFKQMLSETLTGQPGIHEVRGVGLMIGVEFTDPDIADAVANLCYERGLLVLECGTKAIRMSPPLIFTREQAVVAHGIFTQACKDVVTKLQGGGTLPHPSEHSKLHE
ncbi:aminotransferase class III-fold pyridoxal phosphate-dependent enzyme [bacterium]|nr:aminotransferase class III-fold pyridoxal phosphate-dependent enzyme [bacterium]